MGIILLFIAGYLILTDNLIPAVPVIGVAAFLIFQDMRALLAGRKITSLTYSSFIDHAVRQIDTGRTSIDKKIFIEEMEKIRDVLSSVQFVPVVGFDSIYIQYSSEDEADSALSLVRDRGLHADLIQDKSTWSVRIKVSSTRARGT